MADVRTKTGTPVAADFALGGNVPNAPGTPIVVDNTAGAVSAYVLDAAGTVQALTGGGGGGGAPTGAQYVTLATDATLTNERVLTAGTNVSLVDAGAGSTLTVNASTQLYAGSATVDFGFPSGEEGDFATVTVSLANVSASSEVTVSPRYKSTLTDHDPEDYAIEGLVATVGAVTAGVGFDIYAYAPNGTWGQYNIDYMVTP